jgi:hypothetical protein
MHVICNIHQRVPTPINSFSAYVPPRPQEVITSTPDLYALFIDVLDRSTAPAPPTPDSKPMNSQRWGNLHEENSC